MLMLCIIDNSTPAINTVCWKNQSVSYLAHAIVCEFDVSLVVQENVVQLQIAIDDALFMEEVQSDTDFSSIKSVKRQGEMRRLTALLCPLPPPPGQTLQSVPS